MIFSSACPDREKAGCRSIHPPKRSPKRGRFLDVPFWEVINFIRGRIPEAALKNRGSPLSDSNAALNGGRVAEAAVVGDDGMGREDAFLKWDAEVGEEEEEEE